MPVRLVAVDPHPVFLMGLKQLFASEADLVLQNCCSSVAEAREALRKEVPDLLLLDINFPDDEGMGLLMELKQSGRSVNTVVLTAEIDDDQAIESLRLGVQGVVLKSMPSHLIVQCIRKVAAGGLWMEKQSIGQAFEKMLLREAGARRLSNILTPRETEIMCLVAQGMSNRQISEKLLVREGTVKIHVHNIYGKLGFNNRVDLTLYAQKKGLV
ncbi:MAG: response regulator transcription factor [Desulfuromonadales bacterium]|nr:response regulator transcription factor [Desulfuromonadales bacterium]